MRHRRPAQRRQVDAFQRADQGGHRGGELSVLHDRAEYRHRRSARSAARRARRDRQAGEGGPGDRRVRRYRGARRGRIKGEGLGNQFLANIRETDAIAHVVRCFEDPNVVHVAGKVDPVSDIEMINTELALADLATVEKQLARYGKVAQSGRRQGSAAARRGAREMPARAERGAAGALARPRRRGASRCCATCRCSRRSRRSTSRT